jgi:DNA-binding CsgD family transcriptional regulator
VIRLDRTSPPSVVARTTPTSSPDPRVSRVHAEIRKEAGAVIVTDLGSSAGTKVNGEEITGPAVIRHGDKVSFGPVTATFEDPAAASQAEDATMVLEVPKVETGPHLSPRQQQVLELMAEGMTNAEIGEQLGVTERTVKAYAQELYDKLGVRNRAGAVAEAAKLGLL